MTVDSNYSFALQASAYNGAEELNRSYFQVTGTQGVYTGPVKDVFRNREDIYEIDSADTPIDWNLGIDLSVYSDTGLAAEQTYWVRMKYRDKNLQWSAWSDELEFVLTPGTVTGMEEVYFPERNNDANSFSPGLKSEKKIYSLKGNMMSGNHARGPGIYFLIGRDGKLFKQLYIK